METDLLLKRRQGIINGFRYCCFHNTMFLTKFHNYTIDSILEFTKYIIAMVRKNYKLSYGKGFFPIVVSKRRQKIDNA